MSTVSRTKTIRDFSDAEKVAVTSEFDREFVIDSFRELTPQQRAEWDKIQRRLELTAPEPNYQLVKSRLPRSLIRELDSLARNKKISRSRLILLALGLFVARERTQSKE